MLVLYVEAPFAVFRTFSAGWYRPTATFLSPSAAYGLLLNLAGVETLLIKAVRSCFSTAFQVIFPDSSLFLTNLLSNLFDVVLSCFSGNSNGPKVIKDRAELNFSSEAVLNNHLASGSNV